MAVFSANEIRTFFFIFYFQQLWVLPYECPGLCLHKILMVWVTLPILKIPNPYFTESCKQKKNQSTLIGRYAGFQTNVLPLPIIHSRMQYWLIIIILEKVTVGYRLDELLLDKTNFKANLMMAEFFWFLLEVHWF